MKRGTLICSFSFVFNYLINITTMHDFSLARSRVFDVAYNHQKAAFFLVKLDCATSPF